MADYTPSKSYNKSQNSTGYSSNNPGAALSYRTSQGGGLEEAFKEAKKPNEVYPISANALQRTNYFNLMPQLPKDRIPLRLGSENSREYLLAA